MLKPEDNRNVNNKRNPSERIKLKVFKTNKLSPGTETLSG